METPNNRHVARVELALSGGQCGRKSDNIGEHDALTAVTSSYNSVFRTCKELAERSLFSPLKSMQWQVVNSIRWLSEMLTIIHIAELVVLK